MSPAILCKRREAAHAAAFIPAQVPATHPGRPCDWTPSSWSRPPLASTGCSGCLSSVTGSPLHACLWRARAPRSSVAGRPRGDVAGWHVWERGANGGRRERARGAAGRGAEGMQGKLPHAPLRKRFRKMGLWG